MNLKVIGTGSSGNAYLLETEEECLLIECGVKFTDIKKALDFNIDKVVACLVTHEHLDHAKSIKDVVSSGIEVIATKGTLKAFALDEHWNVLEIKHRETLYTGNFKIMAFNVKHDANEPCGFLIEHPECGRTLFMTDTFYSPYMFPELNNIIIEANYCREIMKSKLTEKQFLSDRILQSHMSIETCIGFLNANDLSSVNNIVLIHLSDSNSNEANFKYLVEDATGKTINVAHNGMNIQFNKTPF